MVAEISLRDGASALRDSTFGADQRQRAAMRFRSAVLATAEATPLRGATPHTDELDGSDAPHEQPSDANLRLDTVDSDPALIPAGSSTHWSAGEAARM